jgi:hypothetical protein
MLLRLNGSIVEGQLTLEQGVLDPEELEAQLAEEEAVLGQLARFGQVVTIGYASNPARGIFDLGWGDAELVNEDTGEVVWRYWEQLPPWDQAAGGASGRPWSPLAPQGSYDHTGRFDDVPLKEDLGLSPRPPAAEPPISEPGRPQKDTGSDKPE